MDFDEYDYLEKAVEDTDSSPKNDKDKERKSREGSDRSYRKRDGDRSIDDVQEDDGRRNEDRKSKRSRGDDDRSSRDRDRHRRDRDRDSERDRDRDRERSHRDKDKDKERDRGRSDKEKKDKEEKEKDRGEKERDREKRREKDRESEREREKERERERRSRSSSRKRESERELIRERERELEMRESRRFKDKKEMAEPEADPERDQRTVFAYQMPLKATERDVYEFFSKAGKVRDVRLIMDRNSRRSKGVGNAIMMRDDGNTLHSCFINSSRVLKASDSSKETQLEFPALGFLFPYISLLNALYIEFYDVMSVPMAIALCGQLLLGQPVMVKPSEAEKNLVQSTAAGSTGGLTGPYGAVDRKLYVGNLHFSITETQLREIFEAFGPVELVQLPLDIETGQCKGFGFVQFSHLEHAKAAQTLNGKLEIAGRVVKVSSVTDHVGAQETGVKSADFDDDDGGGLSLNAQSRALLMQKLDRTGTATSIVGSLGVPARNGSAPIQQTLGLPINGQAALPLPVLPAQVLPTPVSEPVGNPSECLLLKNMFDPETEEEPDFDLDIKDDVGEECSKYGRVKHIYVDKNSAGFVYVRFDTVEAAMGAQRAMHMRWFARRLISALYMQPQDYEAKFGAGA